VLLSVSLARGRGGKGRKRGLSLSSFREEAPSGGTLPGKGGKGVERAPRKEIRHLVVDSRKDRKRSRFVIKKHEEGEAGGALGLLGRRFLIIGNRCWFFPRVLRLAPSRKVGREWKKSLSFSEAITEKETLLSPTTLILGKRRWGGEKGEKGGRGEKG